MNGSQHCKQLYKWIFIHTIRRLFVLFSLVIRHTTISSYMLYYHQLYDMLPSATVWHMYKILSYNIDIFYYVNFSLENLVRLVFRPAGEGGLGSFSTLKNPLHDTEQQHWYLLRLETHTSSCKIMLKLIVNYFSPKVQLKICIH